MAKIILGKRPKHFKKTINFPMLDGTVGSVEVNFIYRTRKEFGAYIDSLRETGRARAAAETEAQAAAEARGEKADADAVLGTEDVHGAIIDANVEYVMGIIDGWNLDIPFDKEAVEQLADELPGAMNAIIETYRLAMTEGRLGN